MSHAPASDSSLNFRSHLPRRLDWRIDCIGAGFIMRDCHLLAYHNAGFNPVAIASRNPQTARDAAALRKVPRVHERIDDLLSDSTIEVLDIAVPPDVQPGLIRRAVEKGKGRLRGILAQKPLALNTADARDLVMCCTGAGVVLAVNQNMRFDESVRAAMLRDWCTWDDDYNLGVVTPIRTRLLALASATDAAAYTKIGRAHV